MKSSQAAFDFIVSKEVTSEAVYRKKYRRPEWPGEKSGPTVGIGYDLGQTPAGTIRADWSGRVSDAMLEVMMGCAGHTAAAGKSKTAQVRNLIDIPWETALAVHKECVVPRWETRLAKALPNTDKLSGDSFGALLSLIFNRGTSFNLQQDRYKEMRAIKTHMAAQNFAEIPDEIRSMKRIWPSDDPKRPDKGLRDRREQEAAMFERGLKVKPAPKPVTPPDIEPAKPRSLWADLFAAIMSIFKRG